MLGCVLRMLRATYHHPRSQQAAIGARVVTDGEIGLHSRRAFC